MENLQLWSTVIGFIVLAFSGGLGYGKHRAILTEHARKLNSCKIDELMTEKKCREFHESKQEGYLITLDHIKESLTRMEKKQLLEAEKSQKYQLSLAGVIAREGNGSHV